MKTQHALAAAVMVFLVAPILLGLGSFFVIPLVLLTAAVLPVAVIVGIAALVLIWSRTPHVPRDDFHMRPRPHTPVHAAH